MLMFNDISWRCKENKPECDSSAQFRFDLCKKISSRTLVISPTWVRNKVAFHWQRKTTKENGIESLNWWWSNSEKADTQFTEPRVHCLEERSKAKEVENYQYTSALMRERLKLFFTQSFLLISSVPSEQSQICVRKYSSCRTSTGRPVLAGQSNSLFAPANLLMTTHTPSIEILAQENLLQKHKERVENLPQSDQLIKMCIDAGFLKQLKSDNTSWQNIHMNSHKLMSQWLVVSTLCREMKNHLTRKGGIRGNTKIRPVLEVTTSCLQGKYEVEITIETANRDNSHSWVRISHGLNKLATDLSNNKRTTIMSRKPLKWSLKILRWKRMYLLFCKPIKGLSETTKTYSCLLIYKNCTDLWKILDWYWARNLFAYRFPSDGPLPREEDGAIEFWRLKDCLRYELESSLNIVLMMYGRAKWQEAEATIKEFNTVLARQDKKFFTSERFKVIQDAIPWILHCRTMCFFRTTSSRTFIILDVQSICTPSQNSGLIQRGQNLSKRQMVFLTFVDPMNKEHKDPNIIDLEAPRLARYHQKNWKKHQNTVHWVEKQLAQRKGLKFYQTRSNAIIFNYTLPAYCILKVVVMKSEEIIYQKVYVSPRPPQNITYKDIWMCDLDSDVAGSSKDTQRIQTNPKTQLSSTERPVCVPESKERCVLTPEHVEEDQTGTGRPVTVD